VWTCQISYHLLATDPLRAKREPVLEPLDDAYHEAFAAIADDPNQRLVVAKRDQQVAGVHIRAPVVAAGAW